MKGDKLYISFQDYAYIKFTKVKPAKIAEMLDINLDVIRKARAGEGRRRYLDRYRLMTRRELQQMIFEYVPVKVDKVRNMRNQHRTTPKVYSFANNVFTVTFDKMASVYNPAITRND